MKIKHLLLSLLVLNLQPSFAQEKETLISEIQGSGNESPMVGQKVKVKGIVTAVFAGKEALEGFFIQSLQPDNNPNTSEGLFIHDPQTLFKGNVGDVIVLTGEVAEYKSNKSSLTQLKNIANIQVQSTGQKLPQPELVSFPVNHWEKYEGMRVKVKEKLFVTELYQLGRNGSITLSANGAQNLKGTDGRLDQFTQFNRPDTQKHMEYLRVVQERKIVLDDASSVRNPGIIPFSRDGKPFQVKNAVRGGDYVKNLVGIVDDRFDAYRIQPTQEVKFIAANQRSEKSPIKLSKSQLIIAGANVLNYFNGDGLGGGFPTSRGASSKEEYERQKAKTLNVLLSSNADVISLMEIEDDGFGPESAIQSIVNDLNAASQNKRAFQTCPVEKSGTDYIRSAIIYDSKKVKAIGAAAVMPDGYGTAAFDSTRRKPIAQTFQDIKTQQEFTVVAIHYKSKGSLTPGDGNEDRNDGQGRNNALRVQQSQDLVHWLASKPTGSHDPDYLLIGDFNAYAMEDPLFYLQQNGFETLFPIHSYSYVYDGFWGSLDHAMVTPSFKKQVKIAAKWHINADEAPVLDYNMEYKNAQQIKEYFDESIFRSSDHDPMVIGLKLKKKKAA